MTRTAISALPVAAALAAAVGLSAIPDDAEAVVTARWVVDTYEEFAEGEGEAALITSLGEVRPGWNTDEVALEFPNSWSAVSGPDAVYLGTDDDASIYTVRGDDVSKLASITGAVAVVALARGDDGTVYAGTMPGGAVWRVSPSGQTAKLAELEGAETVWSLAVAGDTVYAGTGPEGTLFAVDPASGESRKVFETGDKRIMSLATTGDGAVWMGTSDNALVFRHVPERGITRAMADFAGNEVTALAAWNGGVVAAANLFKEPTTPHVKTAAAVQKAKKEPKEGESPDMPDTGSTPGADARERAGSEPRRKGARKGKGALYHVRADGQLRQLHALTSTYVSSVATARDGRIFAGAGDEGRIYLVDTDESVSTAVDVAQRVIAQILWDRQDGLSFVTADATAYYRTAGAADSATYTSEVFDAEAPAQFGKLAWRSGGNVKVETRTGNTAEPGPGWSAWQKPRRVRGAGIRRAATVASPPGRYLQYRATFSGDGDAVLRRSTLYYLPQNRPTRITTIDIADGDKDEMATTKSGAAEPRSPVVKVRWKVNNEDDDDTTYELAVRREGEVRWRPLTTGSEPLTDENYEWNTETFPDGYYRLRVSASDRRANSDDRAHEHHKMTPLFLVDNQKPAIAALDVDLPSASARASDAMSAIAEMAYSVDDGPWRVGATRDGLFDEMTEILAVDLPRDLDSGIHTLAIRVADEAGNITSASTTFRVP